MEIASGRYWDNRNAGDTSCSCNWSGLRAYVFDKVYHKGCNCGHKKSVQHNGETD